jgi:Phosphate-induced protein 1 conserved region
MRARRSAAIGSVLLLVAVVAGPVAAQSDGLAPNHIHFMPTKAAAAQALHPDAGKGKPGGGSKTSSTGILYHGGPVILSVSVAAIYWGSSQIYAGGPTPGTKGTGSQDGSLVGYFLGHLGGSQYYNINSTYYDGSGSHVVNAVNYGSFWADVTNPGSTVSDAAIQAEVTRAFTTGNLTYDANTVYAVFSGPGVNLGGGFGTQYCAYHGDFTATINGASKVVKYAVMPYNLSAGSACSALSGSPNNDAAADTEVNTLAHEIEEANTDPQLNAWYDRRGYENADKCAWQFGTTFTTSNGAKANITVGTKSFLVQMNWINSGSGGCRNGL